MDYGNIYDSDLWNWVCAGTLILLQYQELRLSLDQIASAILQHQPRHSLHFSPTIAVRLAVLNLLTVLTCLLASHGTLLPCLDPFATNPMSITVSPVVYCSAVYCLAAKLALLPREWKTCLGHCSQRRTSIKSAICRLSLYFLGAFVLLFYLIVHFQFVPLATVPPASSWEFAPRPNDSTIMGELASLTTSLNQFLNLFCLPLVFSFTAAASILLTILTCGLTAPVFVIFKLSISVISMYDKMISTPLKCRRLTVVCVLSTFVFVSYQFLLNIYEANILSPYVNNSHKLERARQSNAFNMSALMYSVPNFAEGYHDKREPNQSFFRDDFTVTMPGPASLSKLDNHTPAKMTNRNTSQKWSNSDRRYRNTSLVVGSQLTAEFYVLESTAIIFTPNSDVAVQQLPSSLSWNGCHLRGIPLLADNERGPMSWILHRVYLRVVGLLPAWLRRWIISPAEELDFVIRETRVSEQSSPDSDQVAESGADPCLAVQDHRFYVSGKLAQDLQQVCQILTSQKLCLT